MDFWGRARKARLLPARAYVLLAREEAWMFPGASSKFYRRALANVPAHVPVLRSPATTHALGTRVQNLSREQPLSICLSQRKPLAVTWLQE